MESPNKKQRTANGIVPGVGATEAMPAPLPHQAKKKPEFELPVASIVRLVKRVRIISPNFIYFCKVLLPSPSSIIFHPPLRNLTDPLFHFFFTLVVLFYG